MTTRHRRVRLDLPATDAAVGASNGDAACEAADGGLDRSPSPAHRAMQSRLRAVSEEAAQALVAARDANGHAPGSKASLEGVDSPTSGPAALEEKLFRAFPFVTGVAGFFVYAVNLMFRSIAWFRFARNSCELGFRTIVWATMLLPVLLSYAVAYFRDPRIHRRIRFGPGPREYLDVYVPDEALAAAQRGEGTQVPVVVALMGGGFVVGHRSYNVQLGLRCMDFGVMFVCIDYRNFPFAQVPDMVENVSRGVSWVFGNIEAFGGDTRKMVFAGQSAGAHLGAMMLLEHCLLEEQSAEHGETFDSWSVKDFKMYLGVSGPYDILKMSPHLGLPRRAVDWLTLGDNDSCSPERLLLSDEWEAVAESATARLPPIHLFHGAVDQLVPPDSSSSFYEALRSRDAKVTFDLRPGINHTYPVIEGPMVRHDIQLELILPVLLGAEVAESRAGELRVPVGGGPPAMCPRRVVRAAARLSPFGPHPPDC